ncbi:Capsular polysaccharide type 8 biosynthesis protein cap8A [uncultured Clostridium sp.]|uniref:YveK family protein n=1 Tax=uncultured Clostridium sp. TaxID=59620 RepID=UPI00082233C8|nr:Wzz/FepE/Etk N-terminal domain-containing protein [uncultured Clostridium sp.]SCJ36703.1 Capsular polysaccharide type 8 biosynthesis protein cap8A [uncultured Clostridium sp.]
MSEIRFENIFEILKKNLRFILIITLLMTLVSAIITIFFISPEYEASTKVYIGKERFKNVSTTYTSEEVNMYQRLIKTYSELVKTKDLVRKSISNVGQDISVNEALSKVQAISIADTQILQIKYVSNSREESYDMVYGITEEFMRLSKKLYPNGNVQIIQQPIVPEGAIGPNKMMNIAIGAILGIMIGVGLTFLKVFVNNSFSDKEEIERAIGVSCLGVIPKID